VSDLSIPDLLHTTQLGILNHLPKWIFYFLKIPKQLEKYNAITLSVPGYHDVTPNNASYEEVSQWNGKEMKEMCRDLHGIFTQSPQGGCRAQSPIVNHAIVCTRAF
jgi:hypothetical protein